MKTIARSLSGSPVVASYLIATATVCILAVAARALPTPAPALAIEPAVTQCPASAINSVSCQATLRALTPGALNGSC